MKSINKNEIICTMKVLGSLTIWSNNGIPKINGVPFNSLRNHLYTFDCSMIEINNKEQRIEVEVVPFVF